MRQVCYRLAARCLSKSAAVFRYRKFKSWNVCLVLQANSPYFMDGPGFHRHWPQEATALECTTDDAEHYGRRRSVIRADLAELMLSIFVAESRISTPQCSVRIAAASVVGHLCFWSARSPAPKTAYLAVVICCPSTYLVAALYCCLAIAHRHTQG